MIKKIATFSLIFFLVLSFQSKASIYKTYSGISHTITLDEIEESILPSNYSSNNLGDSAYVNYLDIAACDLYSKFNFKKWNGLDYDVFLMAYKGYLIMKNDGYISNSRYLTVMNFELSANNRRLWVLDLEKHKIVVNDFVSHGRNSGEEFARSFSNTPESFKSSLGFYVTGEPYMGKNDYSLRLHGVEEGFNDNALERGIVMHGADYVCSKYIKNNKRLGRSQGCPAVSPSIARWLIDDIQGGSCLFIYYPDKKYLRKSEIVNAENPGKDFFLSSGFALNLP